MNRFLVFTFALLLSFFAVIITGCKQQKDPDLILNQIQDNKQLYIVPEIFTESRSTTKTLIDFDSVSDILKDSGIINTEANYFAVAQKMGVNNIIVPKQYINEGYNELTWIKGRNFRVCPGTADLSRGDYFVHLVWDNNKETYGFLRFIYYPVEQ